ncbi:hypothetical protein [Aurantiacibacter sp. D1-12]|uniref:hypothetical protein n=1 Tax=Aurantiacibacter sp. D1-12 TaxID=2993658 RepID=UPI00237C7C49|nr:hypothetical protein [Aurantiacibacter sp. D1-12]MDE1467840.1 hypothetical protein [Aurantiacibacter sp. D1-12]
MKLPKIDLASLPDLPNLTGMFGSTTPTGTGPDDTIIVLATMVYDLSPPAPPGLF